jgi:6-phospho-beta-glucosidase
LLGGPQHAGVHVANVRNDGHFPFLSDDAVIEVPCDVSSSGVVARPAAPLEPLFAGLVANVSAYEDLALDAAMLGGRDRVFAALLAHPLIGQYDVAETLTDALLAGNQAYLPWARS